MDIGSVLHEARERRGLTLHQLSGSTKISVAMLEHIERNEFDQLPGSVFSRGYLHAFASSVGVEERPLMQEFELLSRPPSPPRPRVDAPRHVVIESERRTAMPLLAALLLVGAGYLVYAMARGSSAAPAVAEAIPAETVLPAATSTPTAPVASWPVSFEMRFSGNCWMEAAADGERVVYRLVSAGEQVNITAAREIVLRIGDPTTVTYTVNGVTGAALGRPGTPATVRITPETLPQLLQSR